MLFNYWVNKLPDVDLIKYSAFVYRIEFNDGTFYIGYKTLTVRKTRVINGKRKRITELKKDINDYCSSSPAVQARCASEPFIKTITSYHTSRFEAQLEEATQILNNRANKNALNEFISLRGKISRKKQ